MDQFVGFYKFTKFLCNLSQPNNYWGEGGEFGTEKGWQYENKQ